MAPQLDQHKSTGTTIIEYGLGGQRKRRYKHQVDMNPEGPSGKIRGHIMFVLPDDKFAPFINQMLEMRTPFYFDIRFKNVEPKTPKKQWYMLRPKDGHLAGLALHALHRLLMLMKRHDIPIIWKEDDWGYEIDPEGKILRNWTLEPF